jgi:hypothetical protein
MTSPEVRKAQVVARGATRREIGLNPLCDGAHCTGATGEVRVYPGFDRLEWRFCRACWEHENARRRERAKLANNPAAWPTSVWGKTRSAP